MERGRAAILAADVVGYSRRMGDVEIKNIARPARVFRVRFDDAGTVPASDYTRT